MTRRFAVALFATLLSPVVLGAGSPARAEDPADSECPIETKAVEYRHGETVLEGYLAFDPAREGKRPGVLVVHEWWGLADHPKRRADALARAGYVAFALDMFGKGNVTTDPAQAAKWSGQFRSEEGKALGRERARIGLEILRANEHVDPDHVAVIGFCFGGTVALELAWSGAPLDAAVSFHGNPTAPTPEEAAAVKGTILVLHGADDPLVPAKSLEDFEAAMRASQIDWELVKLGGAVHAFTNPDADGSFHPGVKYDERAAGRAWTRMLDLFHELWNK